MTRQVWIAFLALSCLLSLGCKEDYTSPVGPAVTEPGTSASSALEALGPSNLKGPVENFVAPLSGDQEVPPVGTRARGLAKFQLKNGDEMSYHLNVSRLDGVIQSHIHCGEQGVNGPVVVFLFGPAPSGVTAKGRLASGIITPGDVIARPDSAACPGGIANFDDLLQKMRDGETYVNVHTLAFPGGEIRGQIDRGNGVN
ncbi:MAG TPA: CHRD domain-containing protein [Vicinamibacteria bacterium]|nr:CHRD domain-containing protein [Vicinamibacteria bacterium]